MMLLVTLHWSLKVEDLTDDQLEVLVKIWPPCHRAKTRDDCKYLATSTQRLTIEEAYELEQAGIELNIEGIHGTQLTKLKDETNWDYGQNVAPSSLLRGQAAQFTISDVGLLTIDEVDWIEDACTEMLQTKLDEGWRILAVCPPNARRRPDYILGKRKIQHD